jgi:hypothetical protein
MKSDSYHSYPNAPERLSSRWSGRLWTCPAIAAVILIAAAIALQPVHALQIAVIKQNKLVYLRRIAPGDGFSTGYVHSVELSPVQEYFCIDPDYRIILRETTFRSSNVGLPYAAFGNEVFHTEADGFRITNMNRVVPQLLIWADRRYENRLQFKDRNLALYGFAGDTLVQVRIETWRLSAYAFEKAAIWMDRHTTALKEFCGHENKG